jgi:hypothetical protein
MIYLWQQPAGHSGQCGGQGQGCVQTVEHIKAKSIKANMMNDFYVNKCFDLFMRGGQHQAVSRDADNSR